MGFIFDVFKKVNNSCESFKGGSDCDDGCPIAKAVYELCVKDNLVLPVWECPIYMEKKRDE